MSEIVFEDEELEGLVEGFCSINDIPSSEENRFKDQLNDIAK